MTSDDMNPYTLTPADEAPLDAAAGQLRVHAEERWVEIADDMLLSILRHRRPSHPIRASSWSGDFHVSEQVLVTALQRALDPVPQCEVTEIHIHADRDVYTGVTIVVTAQYPYPLIPLADQLRDLGQVRLEEILGSSAPDVSVVAMHVHVNDIHRGDPRTT